MSKEINELSEATQLTDYAVYRADTGMVEDVKATTTAVAKGILAEGKMQGVNVELAQIVTTDKLNLSTILKGKGTDISNTATYAQFGEAIKNLGANKTFKEVRGAYVKTVSQWMSCPRIPVTGSAAHVYLRRVPYLITATQPNKINLYRIESDGILPKYTNVFSVAIEELNFSNWVNLTSTFRNKYIVVTNSTDVTHNVIFKIDLNNEELVRVELTQEQKDLIENYRIVSMDDTLTSCYLDAYDKNVVNLQTGKTYQVRNLNTGIICLWISSNCLLTKGGYGNTTQISRFYENTYNTFSAPFGADTFIDIPEKQCVLMYYITKAHIWGTKDLYVGTLNYFEGTGEQLFNQALPIVGYRTGDTSAAVDSHPSVYYDNDSILVVPTFDYAEGAFIWNKETNAVMLASTDIPNDRSYNNTSYSGGFQLGNLQYTASYNSSNNAKNIAITETVFPMVQSLKFDDKVYKITSLAQEKPIPEVKYYSHLNSDAADLSGHGLVFKTTDASKTYFVDEYSTRGTSIKTVYGTSMYQSPQNSGFSSGYVEFNNTYKVDNYSDFTVECMFYYVTNGYQARLLSLTDTLDLSYISAESRTGCVIVGLGEKTIYINNTEISLPNFDHSSWHHFALVKKDKNFLVFVDGKNVYMGPASYINPVPYLQFGVSGNSILLEQEMRVSNYARYTEDFIYYVPLQ